MQKTLWIASLLVLACLAPCYASPSWQLQVNTADPKLNAVVAVSATTVYSVGTSGAVSKTTDRGLTWTSTTVPSAEYRWYGVSFPSSTTGYMCGSKTDSSGYIYKTTNEGTSWSPILSAPIDIPSFQDIYFADSTHGWAVGRDVSLPTRVFYTTNEGVSWEKNNTTTAVPLRAVYALLSSGAYNVWSVGDLGAIIKSTNGGSAWATKASGTNSPLYDVFFIDINNGWIVGGSGTILQSTNGGDNWSTQTSGVSTILRGVHFTDSSNGWVVGDGGVILYTTNGGTTWNPYTSPTTSDLMDIHFFDTYNGWAVGGASRVTLKYGGPIISTVSPATGNPGDNLTLTITGQNFITGATAAFSGGGITVNSATVDSSNQMTVSISIASGASTGARNITINNPDNIASTLTGGFVVQSPSILNPVITSLNPNFMRQGATGTVLINGSNYENNATVVLDGITVNSVTFNSSTQLSVSLTVPLTKPIGLYSITVTNPSGGVGILSGGFRVISQSSSSPTMTSILPGYAYTGARRNFVINGTDFQDGAVIRPYPDTGELTVNTAGTTFLSATQIRIDLTAASSAVPALYSFEITNPDGGMALGNNILELRREASTADPQIRNLIVGPSPFRFPTRIPAIAHINFELTRGPYPFKAKIPIVDIAGRMVALFEREYTQPGFYSIAFDPNRDTIVGEAISNGIHVVKLGDAKFRWVVAR